MVVYRSTASRNAGNSQMRREKNGSCHEEEVNMPGKNFRQGYTCEKCVTEWGRRATRRTALYARAGNRYIFSGFVLCGMHGIQKAIPLQEI